MPESSAYAPRLAALLPNHLLLKLGDLQLGLSPKNFHKWFRNGLSVPNEVVPFVS